MSMIRVTPNLSVNLKNVVAIECTDRCVCVYTTGGHKFNVNDAVVAKKVRKAFDAAAKGDPTSADKTITLWGSLLKLFKG